MAPTRSLTKDESDRVRAVLQRLVAREGTQKAVAALLGIKQQTVSQVLAGDPAGLIFARRVADATGVTLDELLAGALPDDGGYPNRARAIKAARVAGFPEAAIEAVAGDSWKSKNDPPVGDWLTWIAAEAKKEHERNVPVDPADHAPLRG